MLTDANLRDSDELVVPADSAVGADVAHLEAIRIFERRQLVGLVSGDDGPVAMAEPANAGAKLGDGCRVVARADLVLRAGEGDHDQLAHADIMLLRPLAAAGDPRC